MARLFVQILTPLLTNPHECCARRGRPATDELEGAILVGEQERSRWQSC
jgi:hypothetical protein